MLWNLISLSNHRTILSELEKFFCTAPKKTSFVCSKKMVQVRWRSAGGAPLILVIWPLRLKNKWNILGDSNRIGKGYLGFLAYRNCLPNLASLHFKNQGCVRSRENRWFISTFKNLCCAQITRHLWWNGSRHYLGNRTLNHFIIANSSRTVSQTIWFPNLALNFILFYYGAMSQLGVRA